MISEDGMMKTLVTDDDGTREYNIQLDESMRDGFVSVTVGEDGEPVVSDQLPQEISDALINGDYEMTTREDELPNGEVGTIYSYKFMFEDGREMHLDVTCPLETNPVDDEEIE